MSRGNAWAEEGSISRENFSANMTKHAVNSDTLEETPESAGNQSSRKRKRDAAKVDAVSPALK